MLIDASGLVGTHEFNQIIGIQFSIISPDNDLTASNSFYRTASLSEDTYARVLTSDPFHTGTYKRSLWTKQRYSLTLHVRTHKSSVGIIVFQERNEGCTDGNHLFWRYVHEDYFIRFCFQYIWAATAGYIFMDKMTFCIQWFTSLGNNLIFFNISSNILTFVGDSMCFLINQTIWGFDKAVLIDDPVVGQRRNQTDVWTFWCFYRAHTAVMGIMYVADFEPCTFTRKAARS